MNMISAPIALSTLNEQTLPIYYKSLVECRVQRVMICSLGPIYSPDSAIYQASQQLESAIRYFQDRGLEVACWVSALGHGAPMNYQTHIADKPRYTPIEGWDGGGTPYGYCPADERFAADYAKGIQTLANFHPDMIMLDDDLRLNSRNYDLGCFCPKHLQLFYNKIGETVPREQIPELIYKGGKNKYRDAYLQISADTILNFAKILRNTVDQIDPQIRMGACAVMETWDFSGTDPITIAKTLAGNTKPFFRTIGAPYWKDKLSAVIEKTRLQLHWAENSGVEVFTEGDTYPRPRYAVPASKLEQFDLALLSDGHSDGILKYMYDYLQGPDYETGYTQHHIHNLPLRDWITQHFQGKEACGIRIMQPMHRVENWHFSQVPEKLTKKLIGSFAGSAFHLFAQNGIPTSYTQKGYPTAIIGEDARYATEQDLENGAILDAAAARILSDRGIDTGLLSCNPIHATGEYYPQWDDTVLGIQTGGLRGLTVKEGAEVLTRFSPSNTPASYYYENKNHQRFFVLGCDLFDSQNTVSYFANYYRQEQLITATQRLCGRKLPAVCKKHPDLYLLTATDGQACSVLMLNIFPDSILNPIVHLDNVYNQIEFMNCTGHLDGDRVTLSRIEPNGIVAFTVR